MSPARVCKRRTACSRHRQVESSLAGAAPRLVVARVDAPDDDRRADLAALHGIVEREARSRALAVAEPADARRQALERDALARHADPARERSVAREELEDDAIGDRDVLR